MKNSLLNTLLIYYKEEPNDPFNIYALATEYKKTDLAKALELFLLLLSDYPTYIPTYYHLGKLYEAINQNNNAVQIYEKGITLGKFVQEHHAVKELQNALNELLSE